MSVRFRNRQNFVSFWKKQSQSFLENILSILQFNTKLDSQFDKTNNVVWLFFRGLTNLVDLDLSGNALTSVPSPAVADCKYLMRLSLRSNPISSVGDEAFRGLHELVHLDLSQCGLEQVHPFAFRGLDSLEYLRLEANRLTTLSPAQSFPPNLR